MITFVRIIIQSYDTKPNINLHSVEMSPATIIRLFTGPDSLD